MSFIGIQNRKSWLYVLHFNKILHITRIFSLKYNNHPFNCTQIDRDRVLMKVSGWKWKSFVDLYKSNVVQYRMNRCRYIKESFHMIHISFANFIYHPLSAHLLDTFLSLELAENFSVSALFKLFTCLQQSYLWQNK